MRKFFFLTLFFLNFSHSNVPQSAIDVKRVKTDLTGTQSSFSDWLLAEKPYAQKEALLKGTIGQISYPYSKPKVDFVNWSQITMSDKNFEALLNSSINLNTINFSVFADPGEYDYKPDGTFWVDFADADKFGGGFRGMGNLQEERIFFQFPQLAQLAYAARNNPPLPVSPGASGVFPTTEDAQPFIVFDVFRRFDVSNVPYADALKLITVAQVYSDIITLKQPYEQVNIIGIASLNWCQTSPPIPVKQYKLSNLEYLLKESLLGNLGAISSLIEFSPGNTTAGIHSGQWGTGDFGNSVSMVTAIQILSGIMSQIDVKGKQYGMNLHLHGVSQSLISETEDIVKNILRSGGTPKDVLDHLLDLQSSDPTDWQPRQKCPSKTLTILSPPINLKGYQKANVFPTQTEYVNILTWNAPSKSIAEFRIYQDQELTLLLGQVLSDQPLRFEVHNCKNEPVTYYIVSVDNVGNTSIPASVTVQP